jgi:hypothetical protein
MNAAVTTTATADTDSNTTQNGTARVSANGLRRVN